MIPVPRQRARGFTLIELLVVLAVIAIVASAAVPAVESITGANARSAAGDSGTSTVRRAGVGCAATEAPRGLLYHRYRLDEQGAILEAKIVPPTSQNQKIIERDLRAFVGKRLDLPDDKLTWQCEQMVRNYDPCISCATHFLKLTIERAEEGKV